MEANNKATREALKGIVDVIDVCATNDSMWWRRGAIGTLALKRARAALAKPPRQCDVGTAEEQVARFKAAMCVKMPLCRPWDECCLTCLAKWAQMPYEKGEADGK